jgi:hypothetical protein
MTNVELRNSFNLAIINIQMAERSLRLVGVVAPTPRRATSTIRHSSFVNRQSSIVILKRGGKTSYENKRYLKWCAKNDIHGAW